MYYIGAFSFLFLLSLPAVKYYGAMQTKRVKMSIHI